MGDRVITAHIPRELALEVDGLAEEMDRTRGWIVQEALEQYVALETSRHQLTLDALAEVKQGRCVDHEDVERWASKLGRRRRVKR